MLSRHFNLFLVDTHHYFQWVDDDFLSTYITQQERSALYNVVYQVGDKASSAFFYIRYSFTFLQLHPILMGYANKLMKKEQEGMFWTTMGSGKHSDPQDKIQTQLLQHSCLSSKMAVWKALRHSVVCKRKTGLTIVIDCIIV